MIIACCLSIRSLRGTTLAVCDLYVKLAWATQIISFDVKMVSLI